MRYFSASQNILFSILYVIILITFLGLLNWLIFFILNTWVLDFLNWFNHLDLIWFIILLMLVPAIIGLLFNIIGIIAISASAFIFQFFPFNTFTTIVSFILSLGSTIYGVVILWKLPNHYDFWIVMELLMLSYMIWVVNSFAIARDPNKM